MKPPLSTRFTAVIGWRFLHAMLCFCCAVSLMGQATDGYWEVPRTGGESITEPSPEATAMRRYQDYPVSYATGTADISIPLVGIKSGDLSVSLGISYHTGGIKKTDISTGIGLGWTLTGLGSISRQINGFPDDWKGRGGDIKFDVREDPDDFDYLKSILEAKTDAEYDIYSYNIPGYTGKFIIAGGSVVQLPKTDLWINRTANTTNPATTDAFTIITPEGIKYRFDVTESVEFAYYPTPWPPPFYDYGYKAITGWKLSSIKSINSPEEIRIRYRSMLEWTRDNNRRLSGMSLSYTGDRPEIRNSSESPAGLCSTIFRDQKLPERIISRNGVIEIGITNDGKNYGGAPHDYITEITLNDSDGKIIKEVELVNDGKFTDGRQKLDQVTIKSEGKLLDRYTFDYHDNSPSLAYDAFGYANGYQFVYCESILDHNLRLSKYRATNHSYLTCNSLRSIEEINGVTTSIEYESSKMYLSGDPDYSIFCGDVTIGLRIRSIMTEDRVTGRMRQRTFSYSDPQCSISLDLLSAGDFINSGGLLSQYIAPPEVTTYSMGITFSASAKTKGLPAESAVIYYGKVTEEMSGTGIDRPVRTVYEYDLGSTRHIMNTVGKEFDINDPHWEDTPHIPGYQNIFLGRFVYQFFNSFEQKLATYYPTRFNIEETIGGVPLLTTKTVYEYTGGEYKPRTIERSYYSRTDQQRFTSGVFCESAVFKYNDYSQTEHKLNVTTLKDMNYGKLAINSVRHVLDSVTTTVCYPDIPGTPSRTISTRYINGRDPTLFATPGFYIMPDMIPDGKTYYPLGSVTTCGSESISKVTIPAEFAPGMEEQELTMLGCRRLPSVERWIVRTTEGTDSLYRRYIYRRFPMQGATYFRPATVSVEVNTIPPQVVSTPGDYQPDTVSVRHYRAYDSRGRITAMTDADGRRISATWDSDYDLLTGMTLDDAGLTTTYTYTPLVGCTSITAPSGKKRQFKYLAGRLTGEKNTAGKPVASYSYELYGESADGLTGRNLFTTTVHDDQGDATEAVLYDGFGMPVRTLSTVAGEGTVCSSTAYDALDRPVRQYLPVPATTIDDHPETSSHYRDRYAYKTYTYRHLASDKPLSVISEGELLQEHPAKFEYLCNSATEPLLRCFRYTLSPSPEEETVTSEGYYPAGQLDVTKSTDPDGCTLLTFTDWRGFKMLERRVVDEPKRIVADTYFLYDVMGRLRVTIQPEGSTMMTGKSGSKWDNSDDPISLYAFIYRYDRRGNCVYSRVPGGGAERTYYDVYNRPAMHTTATLDEEGKTEVFLYDRIGRNVLQCIVDVSFDTMIPDGFPKMTVRLDPSSTGIGGSGYVAEENDIQSILDTQNLIVTTANYYDS